MKSFHGGARRRAPAAVAVIGMAMACTSSGSEGGGAAEARSIFVVPPSLDALSGPAFFDHPWPSDLRREASGAIVVKGVYDPYQAPLIQQYVQAVSGKIDGFSVAAFGYLRFGADLDPPRCRRRHPTRWMRRPPCRSWTWTPLRPSTGSGTSPRRSGARTTACTG